MENKKSKNKIQLKKQFSTISSIHMEMNHLSKYENATPVEVRVVFLGLHDIDTIGEKYSCEVFIESRWPIEKESANLPLTISKDWKPQWTPELQIANLISESKSDIWYRIGQDPNSNKIHIYEFRKIKGIFYEKLELQNYPFDHQQLQLKLVSNKPSIECILVKHLYKMSNIHKENFRDSQEWKLYEFVKEDEKEMVSNAYNFDSNEHSTINFFCIVKRKSGYFYFNAFFLIFLITAIGFNTFSIPYTTIGARLQPTVTLMLTSVSFKWVINRSLPPIAYLTTLDVYSIFGIVFLSMLACWHGIIGFYYSLFGDKTIQQWCDTGILIFFALVFILSHIVFIILHYIRHYLPIFQHKKCEKEFLKLAHENDEHCLAYPIQYTI